MSQTHEEEYLAAVRQQAKEVVSFWLMMGVQANVAAFTAAVRMFHGAEQGKAPAIETKEPAATEPAGKSPAAEAAKPAAKSAAAKPDDLTRVWGIGPKMGGLLQEKGITTFQQLADSDVEALNHILDDAGLKFADPTSWPEQAALAAEGLWDELKRLQADLRAARSSQ